MTPDLSETENGLLAPWLQQLGERARLREHTFTSELPLVGGLIARFRSLWNGVATRWYVQPLIEQQSEFNALTLDALRQLSARQQELGALYQELSVRLAEEDRDQTELARRVAELTTVLVRMERQVASAREPGNPPGQ